MTRDYKNIVNVHTVELARNPVGKDLGLLRYDETRVIYMSDIVLRTPKLESVSLSTLQVNTVRITIMNFQYLISIRKKIYGMRLVLMIKVPKINSGTSICTFILYKK